MSFAYTIQHEQFQLPATDHRHRPFCRNHPATSIDELWEMRESLCDHDNETVSCYTTEAEALAVLAKFRCSSLESGSTIFCELYWMEPYTFDDDGDLDEGQGIDHWAPFEEG